VFPVHEYIGAPSHPLQVRLHGGFQAICKKIELIKIKVDPLNRMY
jgi:hypothetical protein